MQQYISEQEKGSDYRNYKPPSEVRKPTATNPYNQDYLFEGPVGLKRDYDSMFKALEYETQQQLDDMEFAKHVNVDQIQYYKGENQKFQQYFDKALSDNKVLYLRVKELEQHLSEVDPSFKTQYKQIIQENEELRKLNYKLRHQNHNAGGGAIGSGNGYMDDQSEFGVRSQNRQLQLQREIDDLKQQNKELKIRLQNQVQQQSKIMPRQYPQTVPPNNLVVQRPSQPFAYSSPRGASMHPADNYCDSVISANEHHNRTVLERCKSIVSQHNYY